MRLLRRKPKQSTWCYCPSCKVDLCSNDSFVSDTEDTGVIYRCTGCGHVSVWDFDLFPVPVVGGRFRVVD